MKMIPIYLSAFLFALLLPGCTNDSEIKTEEDPDVPAKKLSFEERTHRHITGSLSIPSTEHFSYKTYKAQMNADNFEDAIIAVNRLEYAISYASKIEMGKEIAELGYYGNFNYFFFYDGKLDKFSIPLPVASSAKAPLKVEFENIISDSYKDLTIECRMPQSAWKSYYTLTAGTLQKVFEIKLYDSLGTEKPEVYFIDYGKGSMSYAKDILVFEGKIKDYQPTIPNTFDYNPTIEKNGKLVHRWFYNPRVYKYMTPDPKLMKK